MLPKYLLEYVFAFYLICSVTGQSKRFFNRHCPLNQKRNVRNCKIHVENFKLDFNDFRKWSSGLAKQVKASLDVTCGENGDVYLPWPMRAKGLVKLSVSDCIVDGFGAEFNITNNLSDELRELNLDNCNYRMTPYEVSDIVLKPMTKDYDCGQQTLARSVRRNITYSFPGGLTNHQMDSVMSAADHLLEVSKQKHYRCFYSNLEYLDESISRSRSKFFLQMMTSFADYPKLKKFLYSKNGLIELPTYFVNWEKYFPNLQYLDISKNRIVKFNFLQRPLNRKRKQPLVVNLSYNLVKRVPDNIENYINGNTDIILDLTGNPIRCGCNFIRYKRYVDNVLQKYPNFKRLQRITCYDNLNGRIRLLNYHNDNCLQ